MQDTVETLPSGTARTAGSSARFADLYLKGLEGGTAYDGMWNYEAVLAETKAELKRRGAEPLYAIYPSDGVATANSPRGFVDRGKGAPARDFFDALQKHLLSADAQNQIVALGRRPAVGEACGAVPDPSWNVEPLVAAYESQLVEFILSNPERWNALKSARIRPVMLYPSPTVTSAHPIISLAAAAAPLVTALTDPDLQDIAWSAHGFRGRLGGVGRGGFSAAEQPAHEAATCATLAAWLAALRAPSTRIAGSATAASELSRPRQK